MESAALFICFALVIVAPYQKFPRAGAEPGDPVPHTLRELGQEEIVVLRGLPADVQHLHDPLGRHPPTEEIRHGAHKNVLALLLLQGLLQAVAVEGRGEGERVWSFYHLPALALQEQGRVQNRGIAEEVLRGLDPARGPSAEAVCNAPGIAVIAPAFAPVTGSCAVAPVNACVVHQVLPPSFFGIAMKRHRSAAQFPTNRGQPGQGWRPT